MFDFATSESLLKGHSVKYKNSGLRIIVNIIDEDVAQMLAHDAKRAEHVYVSHACASAAVLLLVEINITSNRRPAICSDGRVGPKCNLQNK